MIITASRDGFIITVHIKKDDVIAAGQPLFDLDTLSLDREEARLSLKSSMLVLRQEQLRHQITPERLKALDDVVAYGRLAADNAALVEEESAARHAVGELYLEDVLRARRAHDIEQNRLRTAQTESVTGPKKVTMRSDILAADRKKIDLERADLRRLKEQATVRSPTKGKVVRMLAGPNAFVEVGDPVLELVLAR